MTPFFDSHAHLVGPDFVPQLPDILARAHAVGVTHLLCIGATDGFDGNPPTVALAEAHPHIFASVGIHPHDAKVADETIVAQIKSLAASSKVVAVGEIGLDYYYDHSTPEAQRAVFRRFLRLAHELALPVVIHTRDAEPDTVRILQEERAELLGGVIHCFTGTEYLADAALDLGFALSFSGVLTFKNADPLRAIARRLPRDRVLVETDCPYLTPVPHRGKKNEPAFVVHVAAKLAELWGLSLEEVQRITGENAIRTFKLAGKV